ncbi:transcription factor A, mitochondrial isoform X1 [Podarcis raffonei]|uniref:transcription factor A, mitochondrial isoform X1 n=1 Tax=Podarcis raffonei TaxID=65483 RepID=UPI00232903C0|nr:transcription factor A, mitochondrial isoform X1 [Podarcis raffonei]
MAAALLSRVWSSSVSGPRYFLRCSATCSVEKWFSKQSSSDNRPKQPLTAYIRFYKEQQPFYKKQNPDVSVVDITKKIAHAWRELPASDKQPYEAAAKTDRQIYKEQMIKYKAQLTPAQEAALKEEKRRRVEKRRAARKKRQLTMLGKPKRPRSAFNIFMSEHFQEAKGISIQAKMKNLFEEWQKMSSSQKKTYQQLAEDDKIRYENEMKSWEEQMAEIGREDLIRFKNRRKLSKRKKTEKKVASKKRATTLKKPSGSKVASAAAKKKVKARQSEE